MNNHCEELRTHTDMLVTGDLVVGVASDVRDDYVLPETEFYPAVKVEIHSPPHDETNAFYDLNSSLHCESVAAGNRELINLYQDCRLNSVGLAEQSSLNGKEQMYVKNELMNTDSVTSGNEGSYYNLPDQIFASLQESRTQPAKPPMKFKCYYCQQLFATMYALAVHTSSHMTPTPLIQKTLIENSDVMDVGPIQNAERPYRCEYCPKTFTRRDCLVEHMRIHTGEKPFNCTLCEKKFTARGSLRHHMKSHEVSTSTEDCNGTLERTQSSESLTSEGILYQIVKCIVCEKEFQNDTFLQAHYLTFHPGFNAYTCNVCGKDFNKKISLNLHMRIHTSKAKPFQCSLCQSSFVSNSALDIHNRIHTNEKPFTCTVCHKSFRRKDTLTEHLAVHRTEKPFQCVLCHERFSTIRLLRSHTNRRHNKKKIKIPKKHKTIPSVRVEEVPKMYEQIRKNLLTTTTKHIHNRKKGLKTNISKKLGCVLCKKKFVSNFSLEQHSNCHSGYKLYSCKLCSKAFLRIQGLELHYRIHNGQKPFKCTDCKQSFAFNSSLITHMRKHNKHKPYKINTKRKTHVKHQESVPVSSGIPFCAETNTKLIFLQQQISNSFLLIHTSLPVNGNHCNQTNEKAPEPPNVSMCSSELITGDIPEALARCAICNQIFRNQFDLGRHDCQTNIGNSWVSNEALTPKSRFQQHFKRHPWKKPFRCKLCDKSFLQLQGLQYHHRAHTGEKPFKCTVCGQAFSYKSAYVTHMRIHTDEKPYECEICKKCFRRKDTLTEHITVHNRYKPHLCELCPKRFSTRRLIRCHMLKHHKGPSSKFEKALLTSETELLTETVKELPEKITTNTAETSIECAVCKKTFENSAERDIHQCTEEMPPEPNAQKPYSCGMCKQTFPSQNKLEKHHRLHPGYTPYLCKLCDKSFLQLHGLEYHHRIHTGEKPFECSICQIAFRRKDMLTEHLIIHKGEKPYKCVQCPKRFSSKWFLRKHKKYHDQDMISDFNMDEETVETDSTKEIDSNNEIGMEMLCDEQEQMAIVGDTSLICSLCNKTFESFGHLIIHPCIQSQEPLYETDSNKSLQSDDPLHEADTKKALLNEEPLYQDDSSKSLQTEEPLFEVDSIKSLTPEDSKKAVTSRPYVFQARKQSYSCKMCHKMFSTFQSLRAHNRSHTGNLPFKCNFCDRTFAHHSAYILHHRTHTNERPYICNICQKAFKRKDTLSEHYNIHSKKCPFQCSKCQGWFSSKRLLRVHMKCHPSKERNRIVLPEASTSQTFTELPSITESQSNASFTCALCNKTFKNTADIETHQCSNAEEKSEPGDLFTCDVCNKTFSSGPMLAQHFKTHSPQKRFGCELCGKYFLFEHGLKMHLRCHTGERPFECTFCCKAFASKGGCETHMRIHTNEKPYSCAICWKSFRRSDTLNDHYTVVHTGERPFACEFCGKQFPFKRFLNKHIRLHNLEILEMID